MKFFHLIAASACWGALFFAQPAWALRCGNYLIDTGLQKSEVLIRCGSPMSQTSRSESRRVAQRVGTPQQPILLQREVFVQVEEWVYNFGPTQFMQLLVFEEGRLVKIQNLDYGR
ncbi:MAG: DUF2845 domain-containing protein [Burkholderiales bacterium]|jgi:hypothetical protein